MTNRDTGAIVTVVNTDDNPVPVIIAGMATQSDFAAHLADTTDAHDASAISFDNTDSGLTAINVQDAIDEHSAATTDVHGIVDTSDLLITADLTGHAADTTSVHGIVDTSDLLVTADLTAHTGDTSGAHAASAISFSNVASGLTATDVQAAIDELKALIDAL